jgi:hypothetical protein
MARPTAAPGPAQAEGEYVQVLAVHKEVDRAGLGCAWREEEGTGRGAGQLESGHVALVPLKESVHNLKHADARRRADFPTRRGAWRASEKARGGGTGLGESSSRASRHAAECKQPGHDPRAPKGT